MMKMPKIPYSEKELFELRPKPSYTGRNLDEIAFPLGGIGTGSISLGGWGQLRDWEIRNRPAKQRLTQREYIETIIDGYLLLDTMDISDKSVSVLDYVNPYSFLLDLKPPTGDYSFIDKYRNITKTIHIPAKTIYQSSDYIMVPKFPINHPTNKLLEELYGPYIESNYMRAKESDYWYVYSRRH